MVTSQQKKIIDLLARQAEKGIIKVNEKNAFSRDKKGFDITLLENNTQATLIVNRLGKITFYAAAESSEATQGLLVQRPLHPDVSAALLEKLELTQPRAQSASITMLNKFFMEANAPATTVSEPTPEQGGDLKK